MNLRSDVPSGQRRGRWSGIPLESRHALRRDQLVAAGVQLLGGERGPALTVRAVCRRAGLTERYFYESFSDRDEFVRAVYDDVCTRAMAALMSASTPREAVEQFVALMVDDPVRGRVLRLAPGGEPVLVRSGAAWMPKFIELLQHKLTRISDPVLQKMVATSLIGGLTALFTAYLDGRLAATRTQFIDHCVDMLLSSATPYGRDHDGRRGGGMRESAATRPRG
jgi:AcrR family transcriptional regulator